MCELLETGQREEFRQAVEVYGCLPTKVRRLSNMVIFAHIYKLSTVYNNLPCFSINSEHASYLVSWRLYLNQ